ncbi:MULTISPECIES: glyoxalase superfamily protein [unclassified Hahella]|uniref:glyoxalase superfamily protein n=1 Tax=unclassified Hahella TaxID=2624107 RepID=UPI001C1F17E1|nr:MULTISPECIES: glyoxalase superfamily protein [unclassified Hahella]MBU6950364.1 hypothetical protein [Hahella sp. HN01]MDG9666302.1 glyoxalase superfamily protein [Hahella sp. CR1]
MNHATCRHVSETTLKNFKRDAKKIKRSQGISHAQALDLVAVEHGFRSWFDVLNRAKDLSSARQQPQKPQTTNRASVVVNPFGKHISLFAESFAHAVPYSWRIARRSIGSGVAGHEGRREGSIHSVVVSPSAWSLI